MIVSQWLGVYKLAKLKMKAHIFYINFHNNLAWQLTFNMVEKLGEMRQTGHNKISRQKVKLSNKKEIRNNPPMLSPSSESPPGNFHTAFLMCRPIFNYNVNIMGYISHQLAPDKTDGYCTWSN